MNTYEIIKELAKSKKISISELERVLGVSNGFLAKWKTRKPNPIVLEKIADYFGVSVDYLLGRRAENAPDWANGEDMIELEDMLKSNKPMEYGGIELSKEDRERIDAVLEQVFWERLKKKRDSK